MRFAYSCSFATPPPLLLQLPGKCVQQSYGKEYGKDIIEVQVSWSVWQCRLLFRPAQPDAQRILIMRISPVVWNGRRLPSLQAPSACSLMTSSPRAGHWLPLTLSSRQYVQTNALTHPPRPLHGFSMSCCPNSCRVVTFCTMPSSPPIQFFYYGTDLTCPLPSLHGLRWPSRRSSPTLLQAGGDPVLATLIIGLPELDGASKVGCPCWCLMERKAGC